MSLWAAAMSSEFYCQFFFLRCSVSDISILLNALLIFIKCLRACVALYQDGSSEGLSFHGSRSTVLYLQNQKGSFWQLLSVLL